MLTASILIWFLVPMWLLYGPARICTSTLQLLNQLNELKVGRASYHPSEADKIASRASRLVSYLKGLNGHRGPGFVMFGIVINLP